MPNETFLGMSVQDFLTWNSGNGRAWQPLDGVPQALVPANRTHGTLLGQLGAVVGSHSPYLSFLQRGKCGH